MNERRSSPVTSIRTGACVREVRLHYSPVEIGDFQQVLAHIPRLPPYFAQHAGTIAVDCQDGITAGTNNH